MTETELDSVTERQARSPWRVFALLAVIQFMVVLDASIVYIALPSIQTELGFSQYGLAWVMDAYMLTFGGFMLIGGRAADLLGRRRVLVIGLVVFAAASLACGVATDSWQLVAARAAQGLGAAIVSPAAMALVTDIFDEGPDRYKAMGMFGGIGGLAGATGVLIGGVLAAIAWQLAFLINVPILLAVLVFGVRRLPLGPPRGTGTLDVVGAILGTVGVCALLFAVVRGGSHGWTSTVTLAAFAAALVLLAAFVARQLKAESPLIPRMLFTLRNVVLGNLANTAVGALMFGVFFVLTLYLQQVRDYSPLVAALWTMPISVLLFLGSQVTIRLFGKVSPVTALAGGLGLQAVALVWWASGISPESNIFVSFALPGMAWGFGVGAAIVGAFVSCTAGVHGAMQGAASGLVSTTLQIGGAIGVAGLSTIAFNQLHAGHYANPVYGMAGGQSYALYGAALVAALAVPVVLWLRSSWQPPAHH